MSGFPTASDLVGGTGADIGTGDPLHIWMGDVGVRLNQSNGLRSSTFIYNLAGTTFVTQGSGTVTVSAGTANSVWTPTDTFYHFATSVDLAFGDVTAGEVGQPIVFDLQSLTTNMVGGGPNWLPPWGVKGTWQGTIQGRYALGVFYIPSDPQTRSAQLHGMGGQAIHDSLSVNDEIAFNVSWILEQEAP